MPKIKTKEPSTIAYAFAGNLLYFILCAFLYTVEVQNQTAEIIFLSLSALLWFIISYSYSKNLKIFKIRKLIQFILLSFIPALLFLIAYNGFEYLTIKNQTYNWILFYSVGATALFYTKPALFLLNIVDFEFYILAYSFIGVLVLFSFLGWIPAAIAHKKQMPITQTESDRKEENDFAGCAEKEAAVTVENEPAESGENKDSVINESKDSSEKPDNEFNENLK